MNDSELFRMAVERIEQQKSNDEIKLLEHLKELWATRGEIIDNATLKVVAFRDPKSLDRILSKHPARMTTIGLENVRQSFNILELSRQAFIEIAGRFHGQVMYGDKGRHFFEDVIKQATKEAYTYSVAVSSLVQSYRHLVSDVPQIAEKYEKLKSEVFGDDGIVSFFSALRNANNHDRVIVASPYYNITFGEKRDVVSRITFNPKEIIGNSNWSQAAQSYVAEMGEVQVIELINSHFKLAKKFMKLLPHRTGILESAEFRDYNKIRLANNICNQISSLGLFLQQTSSKILNPYEYLDRYFSGSEIENIYSFKNHSKAQVDYIISLRDPIGLIDQHTMSQLYQLFQVPTEG